MEVAGDCRFCFPSYLGIPLCAGPPPPPCYREPDLPYYRRKQDHQQKNYGQPQPMQGVFWKPPCPGQVKLNVDGSSRGNPGKSGSGGLIRDCSGNWLAGFTCNIGFQNSLYTELYALKKGLELVLQMGYKEAVVESDCLIAVLMVSRSTPAASSKEIVEEIITLLDSSDWDLCLTHVYREANQSADILAKMAVSQEEEMKIWTEPPYEVWVRMLADREGY